MDPLTVGILTPDTEVYFLLVTAIVIALFALWPVRKVIKLSNRS